VQSGFARAFGLDVTAIHAWEQGRRRPDRTARILLAIIANETRRGAPARLPGRSPDRISTDSLASITALIRPL